MNDIKIILSVTAMVLLAVIGCATRPAMVKPSSITIIFTREVDREWQRIAFARAPRAMAAMEAVDATAAAGAAVLPPATTHMLRWDYPYDTNDIVFNVYASNNFQVTNAYDIYDDSGLVFLERRTNIYTGWRGFHWYATTGELKCPAPFTNNQQFFTVASSNEATHLESQWR